MNETVQAERERRGLSVRSAAQAGGVSNTTWSRFEETGHLTGKVRRAVAAAFDWPLDWPETKTGHQSNTEDDSEDEDVTLDELHFEVTELRRAVRELQQDFRDWIAAPPTDAEGEADEAPPSSP